MNLDNNKLAEIFVTCGMEEERAIRTATDLYETNTKVMFRAILWGFAKFGPRATYDTKLIEETMDNGRLTEFQAVAKLVHTIG